ncbi:protein PF14_0175-like [Chrysoperla carnea]|uniref:protein PF14_0175-like n=1 Tax=Chrysoperla carnea TaxID=189513 RepID=UPI001D096280|nr:protein PF14_0175-like [Chrysoperla carnea]
MEVERINNEKKPEDSNDSDSVLSVKHEPVHDTDKQITDFQPEVYLKLCLLKYFQFRTSPNIKLLTLNDTIFVLNYLGCSFDKGDISTFVKLSLRFKNLMRGIPQSIPIDKDQKFDHWYEIFLKKLKSQITEAFNKITSESDENETFIKNYLLSDKSIMRKCISLIERDIIEYSKDNKKSEDNSSESHSVNRISDYIDDNKDGDFSSEDEQPLTKLVAKKKSIDNSSETKIAEDKEKLDRMKSVAVSTIISSLNETENSSIVLDDQPETSHRESSNVGGSNNIELTSNRTGVIENSNSLNSNDQQVSMETANNELISESNPNIDASSSTVEQPHDRQPSQSENIFSNSQTLVLNSDSLVIDTTETVNFLNPTTTCMNDMDNPLISNVISLASDENISIVLDEITETNSSDFNIKPKINPDNETTRKLRSYGDLIKEALNAEITTSEVITLDDDDDDNTNIQTVDATNLKVNIDNMQAINENNLQVNTNNEQSNAATNSVVHKGGSGNATKQIHENGMETHESKKTPTASCLQNFIDKQIESMILTNSNIVNLTEEIPENTNAVTVINNEIGENSHSSNDITINTPSSFVIDKQSINSVPFRTFIGKAKTITS